MFLINQNQQKAKINAKIEKIKEDFNKLRDTF